MPNDLQNKVDLLENRLNNVESKLNSDQFSDRYKHFKQIIISKKAGRFQVEEKDSLLGTSNIGELSFYNSKFYQCSTADTWSPLSSLGLRSIAAGTASDSPDSVDGLIQGSTSAGQALAITHPEAADVIGILYCYTFLTDGGQDITITRSGSDTFDDNSDTGNTVITMQDAGDTIMLMAVQDNIHLVIKNVGCTLT